MTSVLLTGCGFAASLAGVQVVGLLDVLGQTADGGDSTGVEVDSPVHVGSQVAMTISPRRRDPPWSLLA